jgi:hypothetical protein
MLEQSLGGDWIRLAIGRPEKPVERVDKNGIGF